jgi:hypothetical protein
MQSLKVRGPFGSLDFQTLLVLGPLQKLLLPFIVRSSVSLSQTIWQLWSMKKCWDQWRNHKPSRDLSTPN